MRFVERQVLAALGDVIDSELGIRVVDLGLVYSTEVRGRNVRIAMTTPACPLHASISQASEEAIRIRIPQVREVSLPPWPKRLA